MRITRKKYIKLLMSIGITKQIAENSASWVYDFSTSYNKAWNVYERYNKVILAKKSRTRVFNYRNV